MEREQLRTDREKYNEISAKAEKKGGLYHAIWLYAINSWGDTARLGAWRELTKLYGTEPNTLKTVEEFWDPTLQKVVAFLTDEAYMKKLMAVTHLRMNTQFSASMYRRSFHSVDFGYHAVRALSDLCDGIYMYLYPQTVKEMLFYEHTWLRSYENMLALEIQEKNPEICTLIKDAMFGDNGEVLLSYKIFQAIVISGNEELLDGMIKLLLAARLQEGLRQQILEVADTGSVETLVRFLKVCIDEDMFRYSSTIRAFDTWTGLGFGDMKPAMAKQYAGIAYDCLTDETKRQQYRNSENNLETYLSLWAEGCYEVEKTDRIAEKLLDDERKYRRILGWYFVSHVNNSGYRMRMASRHLDESDLEILAWVTMNLTYTGELLNTYTYNRKDWSIKAVPNSSFPASKEGRKDMFAKLKALVYSIGNKERTFIGNPFEYSQVTLQVTPVLRAMISLAGYDLDTEMTDELVELFPYMSVDERQAVHINLLDPVKNETHRAYYRAALSDKSVSMKELAVKRLSDCILTDADLRALAESLRSKSSSLRKSVLSLLEKQEPAKLQPLLKEMLAAKEEYQVQAAVELLLIYRESHPDVLKNCTEAIERLQERKLSTQTEILLNQLSGKEEQENECFTLENGFGIFDPQAIETYVANVEAAMPVGKQGLLGRLTGKNTSDLYSEKELKKKLPTCAEVEAVLERMNQVFVRHADYEYEVGYWDGSKEKVLFGDPCNYMRTPAEFGRHNRQNLEFYMIPFHEEFAEALGEYYTDVEKMLMLCYVCYRYSGDSRYGVVDVPWYEKMQMALSPAYHQTCYAKYGTRYWQLMDIIATLPEQMGAHEVFTCAMKWYRSMLEIVGEEKLDWNCVEPKNPNDRYASNQKIYLFNCRLFGFWRIMLKHSAVSQEDFAEWFPMEYRLENKTGLRSIHALILEDYFRACDLKLIPEDLMTEKILLSEDASGDITALTNLKNHRIGKEILAAYPWAEEYAKKMVRRIVEVEERRGELPTPLTTAARNIVRFEGAEYFCGLLAALGKENFFRGYEYSSDSTKQAVLSRLLKRCYPAKTDTPESLKALLKQTDIKEKRLVEAVMYAPQWAGFAEKILGWQGLKCGVWFFHAHINEHFSAEKETEVALYSPIMPQQFNDGTFDQAWFYEAYEALGEKRFHMLYQSAKYITTGSNQHRRSQLYTDAVRGKLDKKALEAEIVEKRNQEKLRAFPLIPLGEEKIKESLHRYEFIQKFLKESKQFGAQRRESEKKACNAALENLALTMGLGDVNRMTWYLESEKLEEIRPLMEEKELDGVVVRLTIAEDGTAEVVITKNGKVQKTLPKSLQKNEHVLTLKETVKELKEQKRRAKDSLERAMMERTEFGAEELQRILGNPVLAPMVENLVWTNGTQNGFLKQLMDGQEETKFCVAHPYDFMECGEWSEWMHRLYEEKIVQPFKQVFREYYPMTEDECAERTISRRYAGNQVQPKKTVALLRGRGWTVDYEEGLQKVFYKENLIVRMYAQADWFSPADIEAPTLETVEFFDRKTGVNVPLEEVPPILFSETMRDIDLAVSVAHVGGVDPEASHSTVEMRTAIAKELLKLFKVTNVEFVGAHAKIHGKLANYSVHMGSGVVHGEAIGMIAILPVHSQARGRIFLPFADDDPKTAEIMSKIILLADDGKIKDTAILDQIRR